MGIRPRTKAAKKRRVRRRDERRLKRKGIREPQLLAKPAKPAAETTQQA